MRAALARALGFPLADRFQGTAVLRAYRENIPRLGWDPERVRAHQTVRLQTLLTHATAHIPLYRDRYRECGYRPGDLRGLEDLAHLPLLRRRDLQESGKRLLAEGFGRRLFSDSSSGSSGEPVVVFKDSAAESAGRAANWAAWHLAGWRPGARTFHLWGNPTTVREKWGRLSSRAKTWLLNWDRWPAFELQSTGSVDALIGHLAAARPEFLSGYAHALYRVALRMGETGGGRGWRPRAVFTTAEQLHPFQREAIEAHMGAVCDVYGCAEVSGVASECPRGGGYHIHGYRVVVEVVPEGGAHKLVLTDLTNFAQPLIRYVVGDLAAPGEVEEAPCPCGCLLVRMPGIEGRESDLLETPEGGALLVPSFLGGKMFERIGGVRCHQVVLDREGFFVVRLVRDRDLDPAERERLGNYLREFLGERPWRVEVSADEGILVTRAGKFKIFYREPPC